jgi:hypothetical protein
MRQLIIGSLAAGTIAFVIGCGTKRAEAPPASSASDNTPEIKLDTDDNLSPEEEKKPAKNLEARIEATWESKLRYQADSPPTNCAVAGRVRLFATDQETAGEITIELYDHTQQPSVPEPVLLQEWRIESDSLKHFLAEKTASPEYNFVLPWSTYKPEITQVRLEVKYEPKSGKMLSTKSDVLTLDHSDMKEQAK